MNIDPTQLTIDLINCPSVTPQEGGALILLDSILTKANFKCQRIDRNGIPNLFARWGSSLSGSTFCFNGHTDVVPPGDLELWKSKPFEARNEDGFIYGRGAVDMKSAIAAFVAASVTYLNTLEPKGSIVLAITGDEEGKAKDGTKAILDWMKENNEIINHCVVGEPTSTNVVGDTVKIGRRGSLSINFTAIGLQGHVAYPNDAVNPIPAIMDLIKSLSEESLDAGNEYFDPSSLVVTTIDTNNTTTNLIPGKIKSTINIRFNDLHSSNSLLVWLKKVTSKIENKYQLKIQMQEQISGEPFITKPGQFSNLIKSSIEKQLNVTPRFSTSGGTSDARFIKDCCPVVEIGLIGETMHKVNERVEIEHIKQLTSIYNEILTSYFKNF